LITNLSIDAAQRPTESPQRPNSLLFVVAHDVAHGGVGACSPTSRCATGGGRSSGVDQWPGVTEAMH
jgi:hypothetical protein